MIKSPKPIVKSEALAIRGKAKIPGLTHLLSKRPDQFAPGVWPTYFSEAKGSRITDLDGNVFLDMSISGIGANVLGYQDPDVDSAVIKCIQMGNSSSLNAPEEVELAELLCELHPWASKVRYARTGGESMSIAVRIARAATGRDIILFCGYHGWSDWYLSANLGNDNSLDGHLLPGLSPAGVPRGLAGSAIPFEYNDISALETLFSKFSDQIAAVVMEPVRNYLPEGDYLSKVKDLAHSNGALLVFDEVSSGFRLTTGGAHLVFDVTPDIAVFAKAISNGYPMAAIIGTEEAMSAVEKTFISSTYWTDRIGPTAALATIKKHRALGVSDKLSDLGKKVQASWKNASEKSQLPIQVTGIFPMSYFNFDTENRQELMTLYIQLMLDKGILASNRYYANFAQTENDVATFSNAVENTFIEIADAILTGTVHQKLRGTVATPGFKRLN